MQPRFQVGLVELTLFLKALSITVKEKAITQPVINSSRKAGQNPCLGKCAFQRRRIMQCFFLSLIFSLSSPFCSAQGCLCSTGALPASRYLRVCCDRGVGDRPWVSSLPRSWVLLTQLGIQARLCRHSPLALGDRVALGTLCFSLSLC